MTQPSDITPLAIFDVTPYTTVDTLDSSLVTLNTQLQLRYPDAISSYTIEACIVPTTALCTNTLSPSYLRILDRSVLTYNASQSGAYSSPSDYFTTFNLACLIHQSLPLNPSRLLQLDYSTHQPVDTQLLDYIPLILISYIIFSIIPLFAHCFIYHRRANLN